MALRCLLFRLPLSNVYLLAALIITTGISRASPLFISVI